MHLTANYRPPASRQNKLSTSRFVNCLKQITLKNKDLNWALLFSTKKSNISPRLLGLTGDYMSQTLCRMSETSKSVVGQMSPFFSDILQNRKWERYPNRFQRMHEALLSLSEDSEIHCQERPTGEADTEIKLLGKTETNPLKSQCLICIRRWLGY